MPPNIEFDRARTERLRKAYRAAVAGGFKEFHFEGLELLTDYAKHLLEYLDIQLNKEPPHK